MPGVISSNSHCGFSREVGKMACIIHPDLMTFNEGCTDDITDIAAQFFEESAQFLLSGDNLDSDSDLPDNEQTMDLIKYLDCQDLDVGLKLHRIKCEVGCNSCMDSPNKYSKYRVSEHLDPFMGMGSCDQNEGTRRSSTILGQLMSPIDYDSECEELAKQKLKDSKIFSAWNAPKAEEEPDLVLTKSSTGWRNVFDEDSEHDTAFTDTPSPSIKSEAAAGDDSDVDIETVTDTPRSSDSSGYSTQESSPAASPSASPSPLRKLQNGSLLTILSSRSASDYSRISAHSSSTLNSCEMSSSTLLAQSLMADRTSMVGQKRKFNKEKRFLSRSQTHSSQPHVLCSSNSVNFHDYAMSPGACAYSSSSSPSSSPSSTETARPTVLSKRIYKRRPIALDASEKEKQHHHNQLERNRRQKLADLFMDLRDEIPRIANQPKASKVLILNEATLFIRDLHRREKQQEDDISREIRKKELLRNQLRQLEAQISNSKLK